MCLSVGPECLTHQPLLPFSYVLRRRGRAVLSSSGDMRVRNSRTKENMMNIPPLFDSRVEN